MVCKNVYLKTVVYIPCDDIRGETDDKRANENANLLSSALFPPLLISNTALFNTTKEFYKMLMTLALQWEILPKHPYDAY